MDDSASPSNGSPGLPFVIALRPSRACLVAIWLAHVLPCVAALWPDVPAWARVVVFVGVAVSAWRTRGVLRRRADQALSFLADGRVQWHDGGGVHDVDVAPTSVAVGWAVIVHWRHPARRRTEACTVFRDGVDASAWRQLRIWIRWRAPALHARRNA
ncbi:MAG: protein YgfX [Rhodocyclaceae bacterium]